MILDSNRYRVNIPAIKAMTINKTPEERFKFIGEMAVATGVPIIIVCVYMGELYGFSDELKAFITRLKTFYTVTDVL